MKSEVIMVSEINQIQTNKYTILTRMYNLEQKKYRKTAKRV